MQHGLVWVQHVLVVSVLGCCTAAPGSNPARHSTLGPAGRKLFARCRSHLPSSGRKIAQQENIPRKNNVCIVRKITKMNKKRVPGTAPKIKKYTSWARLLHYKLEYTTSTIHMSPALQYKNRPHGSCTTKSLLLHHRTSSQLMASASLYMSAPYGSCTTEQEARSWLLHHST